MKIRSIIYLLIVIVISCTNKSGQGEKIFWIEDSIIRDAENKKQPTHIQPTRINTSNFAKDKLLLHDHPKANVQLLFRDGYITLYDYETHCPVYSSWKLTKERIGGNIKRCRSFFPDTEIREEDRVTNDDYKGSGWSRGHMCPAGDNKDSQLRMEESCLLTNICPQDMSLNNGDWNELENKCRYWARNGYGPIYIVCGPIYNSNNRNTIGKDVKIAVPDGFYKVILLTNYFNEKSRTKGNKMIGFIYPNHYVNNPIDSYCVSVDQVESLTDIDFFPSLPDYEEESLEKDCDFP